MSAYVYLICFDAKIAHAGHYVGKAGDLAARIARHRDGNGARLLAVAAERGISWQVRRVWACPTPEAAGVLERRLKASHNRWRLCPACCPASRRGFDPRCPDDPGMLSAVQQ